MSRTSFLVVIAAALLMLQFFPSHATRIKWAVVILGVAYLTIRALLTYPRLYREKKRRLAEDAADERAFGQYKMELDAILAREGSEAEVAALHDRYKETLDRKFAPR